MENILRDCAEKLISAAKSIVSASTGQTPPSTPVNSKDNLIPANGISATVTSTSSSAALVSSHNPTPVVPPFLAPSGVHTPTSSSALQEHRRIFGYRPPVATRSRQSHISRFAGTGYTSARSMTAPYSKKTLQKRIPSPKPLCVRAK